MNEPHATYVPLERLPSLLRDLPRPPAGLHVTGELGRAPAVAVVGTRRPTEDALEFTSQLVAGLVGEGLVVVSGGAVGIDAAAHRAALAAGGRTMVVAPAGWAHPYPEGHAGLFREIVAAKGCYVSLVSPETPAKSCAFFPRNALLVALSAVVVVVQAGLRSGARNAAKHARQLGRCLMAVPSCPWIHEGAGCNLELQLGARMVTSAKDVVREVRRMGLVGVVTPRRPGQLGLFGEAAKERPDGEPSGTTWGGTGAQGLPPPRTTATSPIATSPIATSPVATSPVATSPVATSPVATSPVATSPVATSPNPFGNEAAALLRGIEAGASSVDGLCEMLGLSAPVVQSSLLHLCLEGRVRILTTGRVCLVSR